MPDASKAKSYTLEDIDLLLEEKQAEMDRLEWEISTLDSQMLELIHEFRNLSNIRRELLL